MAKPEYDVRAGGIQVSVWANDTGKGKMYSMTINKSYKDKDGEWKRTTNFKDTDLPKIILCLNKVLEYLYIKDPTIVPEKKEDF